jgi:hypothetical protein
MTIIVPPNANVNNFLLICRVPLHMP